MNDGVPEEKEHAAPHASGEVGGTLTDVGGDTATAERNDQTETSTESTVETVRETSRAGSSDEVSS